MLLESPTLPDDDIEVSPASASRPPFTIVAPLLYDEADSIEAAFGAAAIRVLPVPRRPL